MCIPEGFNTNIDTIFQIQLNLSEVTTLTRKY